jgi:RNA polymerase sigma-70 factor (ECF subfamily)
MSGRSQSASVAGTTDPELFARLAAGDIGALGELYDRHQRALRHFVARATGDAEDVDDLVHTAFLTAARTAARYDGRAQARPWLMGIAVQLLKRRRHKLARLLSVLSSLAPTRPAETDPRRALRAQTDVERALAKLSQAKRITILLAEVEGLSGGEIAELLQVPLGTVWTRLHAARRELRELLEGEHD